MSKRSAKRTLQVLSANPRATRGVLRIGGRSFPCAIGRSGVKASKREGDGASPLGRHALLDVLYRADRVPRPRTGLAVRPLRRADGWCDGAGDRNYNRAVRLPYPASHEELWRADRLYDIVVVVDYNVRRRARNLGSAIFMHIADPAYGPTAGCVALKLAHLQQVLAMLPRRASLAIGRRDRLSSRPR